MDLLPQSLSRVPRHWSFHHVSRAHDHDDVSMVCMVEWMCSRKRFITFAWGEAAFIIVTCPSYPIWTILDSHHLTHQLFFLHQGSGIFSGSDVVFGSLLHPLWWLGKRLLCNDGQRSSVLYSMDCRPGQRWSPVFRYIYIYIYMRGWFGLVLRVVLE